MSLVRTTLLQRMPHELLNSAPATAGLRRTVAAAKRVSSVLLIGTLSVAATSCGHSTVTVAVSTPTGSAAVEACSTLKDALPNRLRGLQPAETSPQSDFTAAWIDAANSVVTLQCGVESFDTATSDILSVNDVDWAPIQRDRGTSFVTVGRQVTVQVDVPVSLRPEASYLVPLADAIASAIPINN